MLKFLRRKLRSDAEQRLLNKMGFSNNERVPRCVEKLVRNALKSTSEADILVLSHPIGRRIPCAHPQSNILNPFATL